MLTNVAMWYLSSTTLEQMEKPSAETWSSELAQLCTAQASSIEDSNCTFSPQTPFLEFSSAVSPYFLLSSARLTSKRKDGTCLPHGKHFDFGAETMQRWETHPEL